MVVAFASSSVVEKGSNHAHFESETRAHDEVFHNSVQLQCAKRGFVSDVLCEHEGSGLDFFCTCRI